MPRSDRLPSRWWFWCIPALANAYVLLTIMVCLIEELCSLRFLHVVADVLQEPGVLFVDNVARPTFGDWGASPDLSDILLTLGLWESCAVVLGMVCYGGALIVYAGFPAGGAGGEQSDASQ